MWRRNEDERSEVRTTVVTQSERSEHVLHSCEEYEQIDVRRSVSIRTCDEQMDEQDEERILWGQMWGTGEELRQQTEQVEGRDLWGMFPSEARGYN